MKRISWILRTEEFWVILLSLILLAFSYGPLVYNYLTPPPPGKVFLGSFGYPPDFWGKIIAFQEGRLGHWLFIHKITTTIPISGSIPTIEYVILGHLSRFFPIDPIIFFHLCRLGLSLVFLLVSYKLISRVFTEKISRLIAFTLALFSTGIGSQAANFMEVWTPFSVFQRSAYYPHYLFAFIFLLLTINFLSQALEERNLKKLFWAGLFGFLTSLIHAPNTVSLYLSLVFYTLLIIYLNWRQKISFQRLGYKLIYLLIFFLVSILPIVYLYFITQSYPWTLLVKGDVKFDLGRIVPKMMFILSIGPTLFLSLYGAWLILKKKNDLSLMLAPWSITYIIGFNLVNKISSFNAQRFLQTPFFVILAILSTLALDDLSLRIVKRVKIAQENILVVFTLIILLASFSVFKKSLLINIDNFRWADNYTYYSSPENLAAIRWLEKNTKEKDIVLSDKINGELIAALAGNFPYIDIHITNLSDEQFNQLEGTVRDFYQQVKTAKEAKKFLLDNQVSYVFWADEEKQMAGKNILNYSFLTKVYENQKVIIFKTIIK